MKRSIHPRIEEYSQASFDHVMQELGVTHRGLSEEDVILSRHRYGHNESIQQAKTAVLPCIRRAFFNAFSIILLVIAVIYGVTDLLLPEGYGQSLSTVVIIVAMLLISGLVRLSQEIRAKKITDTLTKLVPTYAKVKRDGIWSEIHSNELVVGDIVRFTAGDRACADVRLIQTRDFFVSQSVITGESAIIEKTDVPISNPSKRLQDYHNTLFLGSAVVGGIGTGIVLSVGEDTVYGKLSQSQKHSHLAFQKGMLSIALTLIQFMALLIPIVFVACGLTKDNWLEAFLFSLSVAVGLTPELLPMVINACLARGSTQMGKKQTIVKDIHAMQDFGSMDILCVDKTGTLTEDRLWLEYYTDILGNESSKVLDLAYLNSTLHTSVKNHIDSAILQCSSMPGRETHFADLTNSYTKLDEQPIGNHRSYLSVLAKGVKETLHIVKGSVDAVIAQCSHIEYQGKVQPIDGDVMQNVHAIVDDMTEDGMKVIAVAYKKTKASVLESNDTGLTLLGYLAFFDAPKKSAIDAVAMLKQLHVDIRILTGDVTRTTTSVCKRLSIPSDFILTGSELAEIPDNDLPPRIESTQIFTELSPKQKGEIVRILQENGHNVGFLGDGMNDLSAETQSNVSISVDTATQAVKETANVLLLKKDLNVLWQGILEGRRAFINMAKYIKITASSNLGNILAVIVASIFLPFFPMTSIQLLLLNLLYDLLCLIIPWDHVDDELLARPPKWTSLAMGRFMTWFGWISSVFDVITFVFLYFILCPYLCGGSYANLSGSAQLTFITLFQTGWFLESMWTQIAILYLLRTPNFSIIKHHPSKHVMLVTVCGILLFTLLPYTTIGSLVGLTAMPIMYYFFLLLIVSLYLSSVTIAKTLYLRRYRELF